MQKNEHLNAAFCTCFQTIAPPQPQSPLLILAHDLDFKDNFNSSTEVFRQFLELQNH